MTTKAQEIKALEQIRKIVAGLGEDSYIATAFEGCYEIAEENIDMDAAFSMKGAKDLAEKQLRDLKDVRDELVEENKELRQQVTEANEDAKAWQDKYEDMRDRKNEEAGRALDNWNKFREQEEKAIALEQEIIKLKAKLYDLMTA